MAIKLPKDVLKFFQQMGTEGGKSRAKKHSKAQLSEWGKKGGRPKNSAKKNAANNESKSKGGK